MIKFLKYEFRGNFKTLLGFLLAGIFGSVALQNIIYNLDNRKLLGSMLPIITILMFVIIIMLVVLVISFIVYSIRMFSNELNEPRGYLTFSVPQPKIYMVLSKITVVFVWSFIYIMVGLMVNIFLLDVLAGMPKAIISQFFENIGETIQAVIGTCFNIAAFISICYLAISMSKVTFNNKKLGMLWIIFLIVLMVIYARLQIFVFEGLGIKTDSYNPYTINSQSIDLVGNYMNYIFNLIVIAITSFINSWILDKKLNL